jgi:hypothetical protein
MAGRKMLRDIMTINDIYTFAEPIIEMLREDYGSYDADALDEVFIEEPFAQHLAARGYEVRSWPETEASEPAAPQIAPVDGVMPVTMVRPRRTPTSGERAGTNERPASSGPTRTRRAPLASDNPRPAAGNEQGRPAADTSRPSPPRARSTSEGSRPAGGPRTRSVPSNTNARSTTSDGTRAAPSGTSSPVSAETNLSSTEGATSEVNGENKRPAAEPNRPAPTRTRRTPRTPPTNGNTEA